MRSARRSGVWAALTSSAAAFLAAQIGSAAVEVYPGPGVETYRSSLYTVEVFDGSNWMPAYVSGLSRQSVCHWHNGTSPTVNFLTFGTTAPVNVRVTRIAGAINSIDVSPHSKAIPAQLTGGKAVLTLSPNNKAWIILNGDDANPLFVFADPPKPPVPAGATYVGPGVLTLQQNEGHYKPAKNEVIYLDGGAWVKATVDLRGTTGVQIIGPGVLSGDGWLGEYVNTLPFEQQLDFAMIRGDWFGGNGASVRGITIVDSPFYNFFSGATNVSGVKLLSPWFFSTDGFQGVSHVDQSFAFVGDNVFSTGAAGVQNENVTVTSSFAGTSNNSVFTGGYLGNDPGNHYTAFANDIDIKTYDNDEGLTVPLAAAFQVWVDNSDPAKGYSNQTYQNIRIEGNVGEALLQLKNIVYIFDPANSPNPPLGNSYNFTFKNITLEGTQKYRSEIKGWDGANGFHGVVLENVTIDGTLVTPSNLAQYFDVNAYVWGLSFDASPATPTVNSVRATSGPASGGTSITITGTGFASGAAVRIGGTSATNVATDGPTTLRCRTPALPAGTVNDVVVGNAGAGSGTLAKGWFADFADVPQTYLYHAAIEKIVRAGVTTGCGGGRFCPGDPVTRDAMAKFLLVAGHGAGFSPPAATGTVFCDVSAATFLAKWIEQLKVEGIASGAEMGACGTPNYHPTDSVTRDAMAKFLGLAKHGSSFSPPAPTGTVFCDVTMTTFLAKWIELLKADGITSGCGAGACGKPDYCPTATVTRGEMAKFLSNAFALPLYGP